MPATTAKSKKLNVDEELLGAASGVKKRKGAAEEASGSATTKTKMKSMKAEIFDSNSGDNQKAPAGSKVVELAAAGNVGRTEDRPGALTKKKTAAFGKMPPLRQALDALEREHFADFCSSLEGMREADRWKLLVDETKKLNFMSNWTRNNVFLDTAEERERAKQLGIAQEDAYEGAVGGAAAAEGSGAGGGKAKGGKAKSKGKAGGVDEEQKKSYNGESESADEAEEGEDNAKKLKLMQGVDPTKLRQFLNVGLVSCRPVGKLGQSMGEKQSGRRLSLLINGLMETAETRAKMTVSEKDWWYSSCTVNKGGITRVHCDIGNLGPSRLFCFGYGFIGGQTWVMAEGWEIEDPSIAIEWVPTFAQPCKTAIRARAERVAELATAPVEFSSSSSSSSSSKCKGNKKSSRALEAIRIMKLASDEGSSSSAPGGASSSSNKGINMKKAATTKKALQKNKIIVADMDYLSEGGSLSNIALPFKRVDCRNRIADFDGTLPHCTTPVFPEAWKKNAKLRPAELRDVEDLEFCPDPETAQLLLDASNNLGSAAEKFCRYVAVFYPHKCALPSKAVTFGFLSMGPDFHEARLAMDDFRQATNFYGQKALKVEGVMSNYRGRKNYVRQQATTDDIERVQAETRKLLPAGWQESKDVVNSCPSELERRNYPLHIYDWVVESEGFSDSIRLAQLLEGNLKQTKVTVVAEDGGNAIGGYGAEEGGGNGKTSQGMKKAAIKKAPAEEKDGESVEEKTTGKNKKLRTALEEREQMKRSMRAFLRLLEGRTMSWVEGRDANGKKVGEKYGELGYFPFRTWGKHWWWLKKDQDIQPVVDFFEIVFGRVNVEKLRSGKNALTRDEALLKVGFEKWPMRMTQPDPEKARVSEFFVTGKPRFPHHGGPGKKTTIKIQLSARNLDDWRATNEHSTGYWGEFEKKLDPTFELKDTPEELAKREALQKAKIQLAEERKQKEAETATKGAMKRAGAKPDASEPEEPASKKRKK
eukprot:g7220.t1